MKHRASGLSKKARRTTARTGGARTQLRFIEIAEDPVSGVFVLVRHYSDGTRREERYASAASFREQLRQLGTDLVAGNQRLILMPADFDPNG